MFDSNPLPTISKIGKNEERRIHSTVYRVLEYSVYRVHTVNGEEMLWNVPTVPAVL